MDKLKDIFSPGHKQDAETLYGSGEGSHSSSPRNTSDAGSHQSATTQRVNELAKQHGAKFDESRDNTKGTTHSRQDSALKSHIPVASGANPSNSDVPEPLRVAKGGALEPVGGQSISTEHGQGIVGAEQHTASLRPSAHAHGDDVSTASVRSGVIGDTPHAKHLHASDIPTGPDTSARSGAPAGSAAVLGSSTDRSFPLSGGTATQPSLTGGNPPAHGSSGLGGSTDRPTGTHGHEGDHKGFAAAAAAATAAYGNHEHGGRGHKYDGPNTERPATGPDFTGGPHATGTANRIDPHMSGRPQSSEGPGGAIASHQHSSIPIASGAVGTTRASHEPTSTAPHQENTGVARSAGETTEIPSLGSAGETQTQTAYDDQRASPPATPGFHIPGAFPDSSSATPAFEQGDVFATDPSHEHHYGRDAAIAGAGAAAAGGLYESRPKGPTDSDPASRTHGPHKSNVANIVDPRVLPDPNKMKGHDAQSTETDPASKTVGPHSSNIANIVDPRVLPQPEKMKQHTTAGPHQSDTLNRADPRVDSDLSKESSKHHYGRDAAIAGGLGAGASGAYLASQHHGHDQSHAASHDQGESNPYTSHGVDPRVNPNTSASSAPPRKSSGKGGWFGGPTGSAVDSSRKAPATSTQPTGPAAVGGSHGTQQPQQHHYGRDATAAGGAGLAGAGAAYGYKQHQDHKGTEQSPSSTAARKTSSAGHPTYVSSIPQPTTWSADPSSSATSTSHSAAPTAQPTDQHHYGRDAAIAGGAGLAGAGAAYGYQQRQADRDRPIGTATAATGHADNSPRHAADPSRTFDTIPAEDAEKHHYGRNAAAAGAAGVAGAGAAHELSKHEAEQAEKERLKDEKQHQKELEKEEKQHQKELEKEEKHQQKELEKEEKHQQKELEKEAKQHQKEVEKEEAHQQKVLEKEAEKEEKQHQKEVEKEEKQHQKDLEKEEKLREKEVEKMERHKEKELEKEAKREAKREEKKKRGGLFGFLRRDKDKDGDTSSSSSSSSYSSDDDHRGAEAAGAAGLAGAGAAAYEHEHGKHERNRLHKDPPEEYVRANTPLDADQHSQGQYGVAPTEPKDGIVIEPHTGMPMNVGKYGSGAGGTDGNAAIGGYDSDHSGHGLRGPQGQYGAESGIVIEPHTGLPMNVGKYGSGAGGTDGNETIEGFSRDSTRHGHGGPHASGAL